MIHVNVLCKYKLYLTCTCKYCTLIMILTMTILFYGSYNGSMFYLSILKGYKYVTKFVYSKLAPLCTSSIIFVIRQKL